MGMHLLLSRLYNSGDGDGKTHFYSRISTSEWSSINVNLPFPEKEPLVVGTCNGLLCLDYLMENDDVCILLNPSTDRFQVLPPSNMKYQPCVVCNSSTTDQCIRGTLYRYVLCFDANSQDYKFLRFVNNYYYTSEDCDDHGDTYQVEVYSLRNNSWKELPFPQEDSFTTSHRPRPAASHVCVNGFCYWECYRDVIASFDVLNEKFSLFPFPDIITSKKEAGSLGSLDVFLLELQGSLGVVIYPKKGITKLFTFWIYSSSSSSWTRQMNLDVRLVGADNPLWFGKNDRNGESLLLQADDGALLEYDYTARKLKKINEIFDYRREMRIIPYVETNVI